jgi:hypothetical protein
MLETVGLSYGILDIALFVSWPYIPTSSVDDATGVLVFDSRVFHSSQPIDSNLDLRQVTEPQHTRQTANRSNVSQQ